MTFGFVLKATVTTRCAKIYLYEVAPFKVLSNQKYEFQAQFSPHLHMLQIVVTVISSGWSRKEESENCYYWIELFPKPWCFGDVRLWRRLTPLMVRMEDPASLVTVSLTCDSTDLIDRLSHLSSPPRDTAVVT